MALYRMTLGIGYATAEHEDEIEIDDSELEGKSEEQIEEYLNQVWQEWAWNYIDGGISRTD